MADDFTLGIGEELTVCNISDWHLGSNNCNLPYIEHQINDLLSIEDYLIINLLGDIFECGDLRVGDSAYEQIWTVNEQLRKGRELFKPFMDAPNIDVRCSVPGNHDARFRRINFDLMEEFCETLGINYTGSDRDIERKGQESIYVEDGEIIDKIWINDKPLKMYMHHGNGHSKRLDLAMSKLQRDTIYKDADLLCVGHNHRCEFWSQTIKTSKDEGKVKRKYYGFTGHQLSYPRGYAAKRGLDVLPEAYLLLKVVDVGDRLYIEGQKKFIDRYRPDLWQL